DLGAVGRCRRRHLVSGDLMPAPTIESHNKSTSTGGLTTTIAVTAAGAGRVIIVAALIGLVNAGNPTPNCTIAGGGANVGAWTRIGVMPSPAPAFGLGVLAWYAITSGAVSAQTVTITSPNAIDDAATAYVTVAGANTTQPLDQHAVLANGARNGTGAREFAAGALNIAV